MGVGCARDTRGHLMTTPRPGMTAARAGRDRRRGTSPDDASGRSRVWARACHRRQSRLRKLRARSTLNRRPATSLFITLNGESFELDQPLSVEELLRRLEIDPRRVAVEYNLVILKRHAFATTLVGEGDRIEIVNFVGGGSGGRQDGRGGMENLGKH